MGTEDRFSNAAEEAKGKAKEAYGEATDNETVKNEGKADEAKAGLKDKAQDVKENVENKANEAIGKASDAFNKNKGGGN